jgi:hypothetical protein
VGSGTARTASSEIAELAGSRRRPIVPDDLTGILVFSPHLRCGAGVQGSSEWLGRSTPSDDSCVLGNDSAGPGHLLRNSIALSHESSSMYAFASLLTPSDRTTLGANLIGDENSSTGITNGA